MRAVSIVFVLGLGAGLAGTAAAESWRLRTSTDASDGKKTTTASIDSNENERAWLQIGCRKGALAALIRHAAPTGRGAQRVSLLFDTKPAEEVEWRASGNIIYPSTAAATNALLDGLAGARRFAFAIRGGSAGNDARDSLTFTLGNAAPFVAAVRAACAPGAPQ
jgi:hypothetical protein